MNTDYRTQAERAIRSCFIGAKQFKALEEWAAERKRLADKALDNFTQFDSPPEEVRAIIELAYELVDKATIARYRQIRLSQQMNVYRAN